MKQAGSCAGSKRRLWQINLRAGYLIPIIVERKSKKKEKDAEAQVLRGGQGGKGAQYMSTIDGEAEMEASSRGLRVRSRYEKP